MFLNSLSESSKYSNHKHNPLAYILLAITLPMGMVSNKPTSSGGQEVLGILNHAEKLFWSDLAHISRRGNVFDVRDAAISLTLIRAFQASLGGTSGDSPILAARLLGEWQLTCSMTMGLTCRRHVCSDHFATRSLRGCAAQVPRAIYSGRPPVAAHDSERFGHSPSKA